MKKALIAIGLLLVVGYSYKDKIFGTSSPENSLNPGSDDSSFFTQYEGKIVVDPAGYWMVIKNGRIYTFTDVKTLNKYQADYPQHSNIINVDFPAWMDYAVPQVGGVGTLPGY